MEASVSSLATKWHERFCKLRDASITRFFQHHLTQGKREFAYAQIVV
jgi:hypothetical protein